MAKAEADSQLATQQILDILLRVRNIKVDTSKEIDTKSTIPNPRQFIRLHLTLQLTTSPNPPIISPTTLPHIQPPRISPPCSGSRNPRNRPHPRHPNPLVRRPGTARRPDAERGRTSAGAVPRLGMARIPQLGRPRQEPAKTTGFAARGAQRHDAEREGIRGA